MRRRRWLVSIPVLLVVLGGGEGYRLTHPDPSLVLSTTPVGIGNFNAAVDQWTSRLYVFTFAGGQYILDTRTGAIVQPTDIAAQQDGGPVNNLVPQLVTGSSDGQYVLIVDDRSLALAHKVPVNVSNTLWFLDDPTDTFYVVDQTGAISIVDVRAGRLLRRAQGCATDAGNAVESHPDDHLFLSCVTGNTEMHDARTGRLLRSINTAGLLNCTCRRIADDQTGRVFVPGIKGLSVVDAHTGALVRTLPIGTWGGGSFEFDAHTGGVTELDPRSGNVVVAPYVSPPARAAREVLVLDGRSGAILHRWPVPENPLAVLVNPLTHHLLVASAGPVDSSGEPLGDGTLSVLDMGSGAIVRQVEVGILPGELFADRRAKRLLVMNRTTTLDGVPIQRAYSDGWPSQALRALKHTFGWLPYSAPAAPVPPIYITVSLLDLTKL